MDDAEAKTMASPPLKTHIFSLAPQICMRFLASVASLAAVWITLTSNQSTMLYGIETDARYSYSSAFKFFAAANLMACALSVISMLVTVVARKCSNPNKHFFMFLHDLVVMTLVVAACAAATSTGFVARYGDSHAGWLPICDNFGKFCKRMTISVTLSYISFASYLLLTVISAHKSRKILV